MSCLSGARSFNASVDCQQVGLPGNRCDEISNAADLARCGDEMIDLRLRIGGLFHSQAGTRLGLFGILANRLSCTRQFARTSSDFR
jgi:hypothetical protein